MIKAEIVGDSLSPQGERLTSLLITFPRIILSEINTHRMLSKNTSSSRAIPFNKMVEAVEENPFIPIAWQKHHSGMQGSEYITDQKVIDFKTGVWLQARNEAIKRAEELNGNLTKCRSIDDCEELEGTGVTKQLCNRLLEPFMWTTMLITGSKEGWDNFFELRNPVYEIGYNTFKSKKEVIDYYSDAPNFPELRRYSDLDWLKINKGQAEIHIMDLAEKIYDAMNESTPRQLKPIEWHIPFRDKIDKMGIKPLIKTVNIHSEEFKNHIPTYAKVSTAMAARTSYTVVGDEKEINYERMVELHDRLIAQNPPHSSPMEHACRVVTDEEYNNSFKGQEKGWFRNYKGFKSYRQIVEESR